MRNITMPGEPASRTRRIGLIVPSSNVTVETELPRILSRQPDAAFTFHSSRMRMHTVSVDELAAMNAQQERCTLEVADVGVDAVLYACLVALMAGSPGEHRRTEAAIAGQLSAAGASAAVASSAGALVEALRALPAGRIALVMPYLRPLAESVVAYLTAEGFEVCDWRALEVADNASVGSILPGQVMAAARDLDLTRADALVISACVQMPSLGTIESAEAEFGIPVLSAATAGAFALLRRLGLAPAIRGAGRLLRAGQRVGASSSKESCRA